MKSSKPVSAYYQTRKAIPTYERMFDVIKSKLTNNQGPDAINMDFESAAAKAIREIFPGVD